MTPLKINANATVASGSTIADNVAGNTLAVACIREVKIENWNGSKLKK